ncbi:MAG TPA: M48 family metallopeptidase [Armatimonadota bacterium]|jgi:Zn-dependent protease with chaperone function
MGHHDHNEHEYDDDYRGSHRYHPKKLKKKLRLFGCGCVTLLLILTVLVLVGTVTGVKHWVMPGVSGLVARLPKDLPLPEGMRMPALPPGLRKLTPQEQIALGREVVKQEGLDQKAFATPILDVVVGRMITALPNQYRGPQGSGWEWRVQAVRTTEGMVNAIALPGGKIYLYDGLLKLAKDDPDQSAMVVGHEMAHVVEEHTAEQLRTAGLLQTAVDLIGSNGEVGQGEGQSAEMMRAFATKFGKQLVSMQLSQSAEFQADALGAQFMRDAGYDPKKGLRILERMDQLAQSGGAGNPILGRIFSTHPPMQVRIQRLREQITSTDKAGAGNRKL